MENVLDFLTLTNDAATLYGVTDVIHSYFADGYGLTWDIQLTTGDSKWVEEERLMFINLNITNPKELLMTLAHEYEHRVSYTEYWPALDWARNNNDILYTMDIFIMVEARAVARSGLLNLPDQDLHYGVSKQAFDEAAEIAEARLKAIGVQNPRNHISFVEEVGELLMPVIRNAPDQALSFLLRALDHIYGNNNPNINDPGNRLSDYFYSPPSMHIDRPPVPVLMPISTELEIERLREEIYHPESGSDYFITPSPFGLEGLFWSEISYGGGDNYGSSSQAISDTSIIECSGTALRVTNLQFPRAISDSSLEKIISEAAKLINQGGNFDLMSFMSKNIGHEVIDLTGVSEMHLFYTP